MWAVVLGYVVAQAPDFAISLAITILQKTGFLSSAQATIAETGEKILHVVGNVRTYSSPDDFPKEVKYT